MLQTAKMMKEISLWSFQSSQIGIYSHLLPQCLITLGLYIHQPFKFRFEISDMISLNWSTWTSSAYLS